MDEKMFNKYAAQLEASLDEDSLNSLGLELGFAQRLRVITPFRLILSLLATMGSAKLDSIADLLRGFNYLTKTSTAYKAYYNRLAQPEFPLLMKEVFAHLIQRLAVETLTWDEKGPLGQFQDIIIHDGSSFAVKDALATEFPGRFTKIKPAAVEVHLSYSARNDEAIRVSLTPDASSERGELPPASALTNCLLLGDRGYPSVEYFSELEDERAFFIMRLTTSWRPRVHGYHVDGKYHPLVNPMTLQAFLSKYSGEGHDLVVSFARNKHKRKFRLLVVQKDSTRKQKKGKKQDPWIRLCTNLSVEEFSPELIGQLYRFRWQVELVFKEWKSHTNLHKFDTENPHIAEGLIWTSLGAAVLKRFFAHATQTVVQAPISTQRVAKCSHHFLPRLIKKLLAKKPSAARRVLEKAITFLNQNARRSNPERESIKGRLSAGFLVAQAA